MVFTQKQDDCESKSQQGFAINNMNKT